MKFLLDHDIPDDLSYLLEQLGHDITLLRAILPGATGTTFCSSQPHNGVVIVIRRKTRGHERAALFQLLERAGETGLLFNVNFA